MTLLDWRQHHLWIRRNRQFLPSQRGSEVISAEIVALPERRFPSAADQTRIVSVARIRPDSRKSARSFKGIICDDISEFESYMPSHAVGLSQVRSPAIVMHRARWILRRKVARTRAVELHQLALEPEEGSTVAGVMRPSLRALPGEPARP